MSLIPVNGTFTIPVLPPGKPLVDINDTFGAAYIGGVFSTLLLGVTLMQAWFYYNHFPKDPAWMKIMVVSVVVVEFIRGAFTAHAVYYYLILNWGNPLGLDSVIWSLTTIIIMTNIGELFGHLYFTWRIFVLSKKGLPRVLLTSFVLFLGLWNFGMGTATFVNLEQATNLTQYTGGAQTVLAPFALATAISTDVAVTISLIFLLNRSRTGYSHTNQLINSLIVYLVEAGSITVMADTACVVLNHYISKDGFDYLGVYAIIGNLYANSLLASLNARSALKNRQGDTVLSSANGAQSAATAEAFNFSRLKSGAGTVPSVGHGVEVTTTRSYTVDGAQYAYDAETGYKNGGF